MTLAEIEALLLQLQSQVQANTAAISTLNDTLSNYATTDDLSAMSDQINVLQENNIVLQDSLSTLSNSIEHVDHLEKLLDVEVNDLTVNDVLVLDSDGKWKNVSLNTIVNELEQTSTPVKLSDLSDVVLNNVTNESHLMYNASLGKWTNSIVTYEEDVTDLSNYLTKSEAANLYFPYTGGIITGPTSIESYLHTTGNITSEKAITAKQAAI